MVDDGCEPGGGESRFVENAPPLPLRGDAVGLVLADVLGSGRSFRFTARGTSMVPFIRDNDVLTVAPLGSTSPAVGDVVACRDPGRAAGVVIHRVVRVSAAGYVLQGDALDHDDGEFERDQFLGVVREITRGRHATTRGLGASGPLIAFAKRHPRSGRFILRLLRVRARTAG